MALMSRDTSDDAICAVQRKPLTLKASFSFFPSVSNEIMCSVLYLYLPLRPSIRRGLISSQL